MRTWSAAMRPTRHGALHQMMSTLSEAERADTWDEIERELRHFETASGFVGPCEMIVSAGTA